MTDKNNSKVAEENSAVIHEKAIGAMKNLKDKSVGTLEVTPEQLVYMVRVLTRKMSDKETEVAAAHAAVALQVDYINSLKEEIEVLKVRLGDKEASQETADGLKEAEELVESLLHDDIIEMRVAQREQQLEKLNPDISANVKPGPNEIDSTDTEECIIPKDVLHPPSQV